MSGNPVNTVPSNNSTFLSDLQTFLRNEDADRWAEMFTGFVVSGGTHSTGAGFTKTPTALVAYAGGYRITESGSITYPASETTYVAADKDTTGNVGTYTRVSGTHYLIDFTSGAEPSLPTGAIRLMTVTTDGSGVTVVTDRRNQNLLPSVLKGGTPLVFEGATDNAFETTLTVTDPTAARTFTLPDADSVAIQPSSAVANQFLTGVSAAGVVSRAQPSFSNLSGVATDAQIPALNGLSTGLTASRGVETNASAVLVSSAGLPSQVVRVSAQFDKSNITLADITGLSVALLSGKTYSFHAVLFVTATDASGHKYAAAYSGTTSAIIYDVKSVDLGAATPVFVIGARATASGTAAGEHASTAVTVQTEISGTLTTTATGNLTIQFALNTGVTTGSVLVGSYMVVWNPA